MLFWTIVKVGMKSLVANKLRSILAMLGIIIGVASVVSMLAIGAGARTSVLSRITAMGTNLLIVRPSSSGSRGVASGTQQNLTLDDAQAILREVDGIVRIAPVVGGNAQVKYFNRNTRASVNGISATWLPIRDFTVEKGRAFTEAEVESMSRTAILGSMTAETLFGANDPLDQTIKLNGVNFRVIGVLKSKGDQGWFNVDDQVLIPYTTAMKQVFGQDHLREIDIQAAEGGDLTKVQESVTTLLRRRHRIQEDAEDDFSVRNQADMIQASMDITRTFTILLGGIASISLLVGGIGIMNIMLVTVTERTREIGVRKAIGAKRANILAQFLIESVVISGLGGLLGVGLGIAIAKVIGSFSMFTTQIELSSILLAMSFAAIVG
ncbi:MAG: ABC transporter permease, partial [Planctomycetota bacterium]|nr:ABC transporter permease [Planctomycetota bacterium]